MIEEKINQRDTTLLRRLILEPGESTPWHVDPFHRVTVIVRGDALAIEHREGGGAEVLDVTAGMADWDGPTDRVHRAVNIGTETYEEVTMFSLITPTRCLSRRRDGRCGRLTDRSPDRGT